MKNNLMILNFFSHFLFTFTFYIYFFSLIFSFKIFRIQTWPKEKEQWFWENAYPMCGQLNSFVFFFVRLYSLYHYIFVVYWLPNINYTINWWIEFWHFYVKIYRYLMQEDWTFCNIWHQNYNLDNTSSTNNLTVIIFIFC